MTTSKTDLRRVERAAAARETASQRYREAVVRARASGATLAEIAAAAGTTKQAVSELLRRYAQ